MGSEESPAVIGYEGKGYEGGPNQEAIQGGGKGLQT